MNDKSKVILLILAALALGSLFGSLVAVYRRRKYQGPNRKNVVKFEHIVVNNEYPEEEHEECPEDSPLEDESPYDWEEEEDLEEKETE